MTCERSQRPGPCPVNRAFVLFETNIAVPETAANNAVVWDGHHPATCASATNSATVMMNNTALASVIGHMALPSNWSYSPSLLSLRAFELRRDIAKQAALGRLGSPLTDS